MQISIPALATSWSSGWAGAAWYLNTIDWLYNIYSARLIALNKYNARNDGADNSQAHWWMADIPDRYTQAANWNTDYSLSTVSGAGALSLITRTYNFTSNFTQIDQALVRFGLFDEAANVVDACITIDDATSNINWYTISTRTWTVLDGKQNKWYIATSGGNRFLITSLDNVLYSIPLDASNNVITWTINTYTAANIAPATSTSKITCVAAKDQYIWAIQPGAYSGNAAFWGRLLSIDSAWVFTSISAVNIINWSTTALSSNSGRISWSYVVNNVCYFYHMSANRTNSTWTARITFNSIDLTNTWTFTFTSIYNQDLTQASTDDVIYPNTATTPPTTLWENRHRTNAVWYDWSNMNVVINDKVWRVTWSWLIFLGTPITTQWYIRFTNTATELLDGTNNFYSNYGNNSAIYKGKQYYNYTANWFDSCIFAMRMTGSNNEDDATALAKIICTDAVMASDGLDINLNTVSYDTGCNMIGGAGAILISQEVLSANHVKLELDFANSNARTKRMWFGIYGWSYNAPIAWNGFGGSSAAWATVDANGSFINLLF